MKYKAGDRVVVKSRKWYDENKDKNGNVQMNFDDFVGPMAELCGKTVTISEIINGRYRIKEMCFDWYDDMFEDSIKQKTQEEIEIEKYDTLQKIVDQLELCDYRTEAGFLKNNIAFIALKRMAADN